MPRICEGPNREVLGSRAESGLRSQREQSARVGKHSDDQDLRPARYSGAAAREDHQALDETADTE